MSDSMKDAVQELRIEMKQWRAGMSLEEREKRSDKVISNILQFLENASRDYEHFLCYYPLPLEVNLMPLYEELLQRGKKLYFPKTYPKEIRFYQVSDMHRFEEGAFHVMEPLECDRECLGECIALIPGLVYDASMQRIGYGGGYYDRFLADKKHILKCGIAYQEQRVAQITAQPWDIPMDLLITDTDIYLGRMASGI